MALRILDLPGPSKFFDALMKYIEEGGCIAFNISPISMGLKEEIAHLIINLEAGYNVNHIDAQTGDLEKILSEVLRCEIRPISAVANDSMLSDKIVIIEVPDDILETNKIKLFNDFNQFWYKRVKEGPILIVLCPFNMIDCVDKKIPTISWLEYGFERIDKMIWALTNLGPHIEPLSDFAEVLAVEIGAQDLNIIAKIAAASSINA